MILLPTANKGELWVRPESIAAAWSISPERCVIYCEYIGEVEVFMPAADVAAYIELSDEIEEIIE